MSARAPATGRNPAPRSSALVVGLLVAFAAPTAFAQQPRPAQGARANPTAVARPTAPGAGSNAAARPAAGNARVVTGAATGAPIANPRPLGPVAPAPAPAPIPAPRPAAPAPAPASVGAADDESGSFIDTALAQLRTNDLGTRRAAVEQLMTLDPDDVPALRTRLLSPLGVSAFNVHAAMLRAVRLATNGRENAPYDMLAVLLAYPQRTPDIETATERVALARALGRIPSADAGRALVAFGLEHQLIFRLETLRIITSTMRDYVLPALIEYRRPGDAARIFIRQAREGIHRVTPGESVQTRDNALLAEILRAFGALRQPDTLNVIVSFVNSDRAQVRDAARWAVAQYGRDAINALRTAYENYTNEDANALWGWERVARELYQAYDRKQGEEVARSLDEGLAASRAGHYAEMMARFEFVLARHPLFERRAEMAAPLMAYAHSLEGQDAARAESIYRMALRIDPEGPTSHAAQSAILFLEAERALARGVADPELYRAALRADPANTRAQAQLEAVAQVEVLRARKRRRTMMAFGVMALALAALGLITARARAAGAGPGEGEGGGGGDEPKGEGKRDNAAAAA